MKILRKIKIEEGQSVGRFSVKSPIHRESEDILTIIEPNGEIFVTVIRGIFYEISIIISICS
jgi:hypothetical protein